MTFKPTPPLKSPYTEVVTIRITPEMQQKVSDAACERGVSKATFMRKAIIYAMENIGSPE